MWSVLPRKVSAKNDDIFQVCGSVRTEPCTPLQCEGKGLCPPEGTQPCKAAEKCTGALPLSKRANADVKNVKGKLERLAKKITDAAEKVYTHTHIHTQVIVRLLLETFQANCHLRS